VRKLILLLLVFGMAPATVGEVSVRVCRADGNTCFDMACCQAEISTNLPTIMKAHICRMQGMKRLFGFGTMMCWKSMDLSFRQIL
jgi:hypothetical protein